MFSAATLARLQYCCGTQSVVTPEPFKQRIALDGLCFPLKTGEGADESCIFAPVFEYCGECQYFDPKTKAYVEVTDLTQLVSKDDDMNTPWFYSDTGRFTIGPDDQCLVVQVRSRMACGELIEQKGYCDPSTLNFVEIDPMSMKTYPAASVAPTCERYISELATLTITEVPNGSTVQTVIDAIWAADGGDKEYATFGAVDLATDTVVEVTVGGATAGDVITIDGVNQGGFTFDAAGETTDAPLQMPVEIPDGCTMTASLCVRRCQDKAGNIV